MPSARGEAPPCAPNANALWARVREYVADKPARRAMISSLRALEFDGSRAVLGCPVRAIETARSQSRALGELLQAALDRPVQVQIREIPDDAAPHPAHADAGEARAGESRGGGGAMDAAAALRDHPLVRRAADLFSARIREVVPSPDAADAR
ncbi:MAG: hypothetical protein JNK35_10850 [Phycisphaerae bacterium]|nr:hypothetical protein [Phycisphaerae bacterium]